MQVSTIRAQLGLESELVDWYRDATSVPYGLLLIDLSPRAVDRLGFCTSTGSIPSKFYIPDQLEKRKLLDDYHIKSLYSPSVPIIFPKLQKSFRSVSPKRVCQVHLRLYSESSQKKPAKHKKTSRDKISKPCLIALSKNIHLESKKRRSGIRKKG